MTEQWERFQKYFFSDRNLGFSLDISRMRFSEDFFDTIRPSMERAFQSMAELESGALANPDEKRMVGHYWLRSPELAPNSEIQSCIVKMNHEVKAFAGEVHANGQFRHALVIGIGGSALGPQFVSDALGSSETRIRTLFFDNTDPDGMCAVLERLPDLAETLCIVISKSGGTRETRNGMMIAREAWTREGLSFAEHAVAVTGVGSQLDKIAKDDHWMRVFPMWDWIGGRTSQFSAVGMLIAALQGVDIDRFVEGAKLMDELTRRKELESNPAALLAAMWFSAGSGKGGKDLVILPYKDRLELFGRYLQQLLMESLGKEFDLAGNAVHQGLSVFGNKGSTDQHAYIQQLRDGLNNFFVIFVEVLKDLSSSCSYSEQDAVRGYEVESGVTSGDYLSGFYLGTRAALSDRGRESLSITIEELSERSLGMLIALFERAVGLYASLIGINAYHQPGVEAGKVAAGEMLDLQKRILTHLLSVKAMCTVVEISEALQAEEMEEAIFKILQHQVANGLVEREKSSVIFDDRYMART